MGDGHRVIVKWLEGRIEDLEKRKEEQRKSMQGHIDKLEKKILELTKRLKEDEK